MDINGDLKNLIIKDISSRFPYEVKVHIEHDVFYDEVEPYDSVLTPKILDDFLRMERLEVKPYLRPMSSMTEEEKSIYHSFCECDDGDYTGEILYFDTIESFDYLNQIHIDYRNLIPRGLAIEATKEMYGTKKNE